MLKNIYMKMINNKKIINQIILKLKKFKKLKFKKLIDHIDQQKDKKKIFKIILFI